MANVNTVVLVGRAVTDPEVRTTKNGGKLARIRFVVNNRRKDSMSGEWKDIPMFIDVDVFNWGNRTQADWVERNVRKASQICVTGSLWLDEWTSQDGQKRSRHIVNANDIQFAGPAPKRDEEAVTATDAIADKADKADSEVPW
ncbi:hypothetical protein AYO40_03455 [Planctomycetaceae bacterium SCGC AG-212-D15]|nr:hypothetical protein AYO40_03455 [Planctomycetaceae bacterium SCGC AG-212-D15]